MIIKRKKAGILAAILALAVCFSCSDSNAHGNEMSKAKQATNSQII